MKNNMLDGREATLEVLAALGDQLEASGVRHELVVIGGSALVVLGLISRTTRDVDLVAIGGPGHFDSADPLPESLSRARDIVARDFNLPPDWLNGDPTDLLRLGLPEGFAERLEARGFGPALTVYFASRLDQIHFKLYAAVDQGPGKHEVDLKALSPTREELLSAAVWSRSHDPSDGYREVLVEALRHFGVENADLVT